MGTKFTYALILTICQAIFSLLMYFGGYQSDKMATGQHLQWLGLLISFVVIFLGIRAVRENSPNKALSYGQALGAGTMISLYSSLMGAVYTYIHFKFINPSFFDYQLQFSKEQMVSQGRTDAQIEQATAFMQKFFGPGLFAIIALFFGFFFCFVISLVVAAILKRNPPAGVAAQPAA